MLGFIIGVIVYEVLKKFGYPKLDDYMAGKTGKTWTGPLVRVLLGAILAWLGYKYVKTEPTKSLIFTLGTLTAVNGVFDLVKPPTAPAPAPAPTPTPPPTPALAVPAPAPAPAAAAGAKVEIFA